jgi:hypothetical protein
MKARIAKESISRMPTTDREMVRNYGEDLDLEILAGSQGYEPL